MSLASDLLGVSAAALVIGALERKFGRGPPTRLFATERLTDFAHFLIGNTVAKLLAKVAFIPAFLAALVLLRAKNDSQVFEWLLAHGPLCHLPFWAQIPAGLLVVDLIGYAVHLAMHEVSDLWRLHAVHHSSEKLDWFAGVRNHPFAEMGASVVTGVVALRLGVDLRALAVVTPILGLWGIMLHANVPWQLGWLRFVIATPRFHRWHHAALSQTGGRTVNLAGLFPLWDLFFGTFYVPDREPEKFGVDGDVVPKGFLRQMLWPVR